MRRVKRIPGIRKIRIKKVKVIKNPIMKGEIKMQRIVSTDTLFKSNGNFSTMNKNEQRKYISQLADEFMDSAHDLMESLKDK